MKSESAFQELFNNVLFHLDGSNVQFQIKDFLNLSEQISLFLERTKEIESGQVFDQSRYELAELSFQINRNALELGGLCTLLFIGSPESGKTNIIHQILNLDTKNQISTGNLNILNQYCEPSKKEKKLQFIFQDKAEKLMSKKDAEQFLKDEISRWNRVEEDIKSIFMQAEMSVSEIEDMDDFIRKIREVKSYRSTLREIIHPVAGIELLNKFRLIDTQNVEFNITSPLLHRAGGLIWVFDLSDQEKLRSEVYLGKVIKTARDLSKKNRIIAILNNFDILVKTEGQVTASNIVKNLKKDLKGSFEAIIEFSLSSDPAKLKDVFEQTFLTVNINGVSSAAEKIVQYRVEIIKLIKGIKIILQEYSQHRKEITDTFQADLKKIADNIKLDFEFLFDRYIRRVSLNIGSKIFDLIQLEDDYEIKSFFLDDIFTCRRLKSDLIELSTTFKGQILKLIGKLEKRVDLDQYKKLARFAEYYLPAEDSAGIEISMEEKISLKSIFPKDQDLAREILSTILFPAIGDNSDSIYEVLKERQDKTNISDAQVKKFMKKMEVQLSEFIKRLNREIDVKIQENSYPVTSIFNKSQDTVFLKLVCDAGKVDSVFNEFDILNESIAKKQDKSNYEQLKELLS